ncbi:hypothetical protein CY652_00600 [Burkholderia sp. WAC0059]|uniref:DUF4148 domain-containing protein n=1 Tax=Burkholderia sp. WAC0059 TaxID=2066022 RepID=UPI000C7F6365|nr:DUF4148 domain-containing protein [Burkholderia sp. WAC0059]PLZ04214.1 hypothetical protein CY652_00600 [Burkholderia sp. WAC0059]
MKSLLKALTLTAAAAVVAAGPAVSFAQSQPPLTRAEVEADLAQLEKAGYNPHDWIHYPDNIQAAEARVAAEKAAASAAAGPGGSAQSGQ